MKTIGVIGLGSIGMRHAKNLISIGHRVVGNDTDEKRFKEFMSHGGYGWVESIETVGYGGFDGVVIASPTSEHRHQLSVAVDYGLNIFIEKPIMDCMGLDANDIKRLTDPCCTMVGYNLRFHSCVKKAREWLDAGLIGKPLWANFTLGQHSEKPPYLRDGVILNWSHEIDLALYLLGMGMVAGSSTHVEDGRDDISDILLTHESGCRSTVHLDYLTRPEIRQHIIVGSNGLIKIDLVRRIAELASIENKPSKVFWGQDTWNDNYIEEMQAFLDRIDGKETIGCSGEEGLRVLEICLDVRRQAGL